MAATGKRKQVNFRLDESVYDALTAKAAGRGETLTDIFTGAIRDYLSGRWAPYPPPGKIPKAGPRRCDHPARFQGGWCQECGHVTKPGGEWT